MPNLIDIFIILLQQKIELLFMMNLLQKWNNELQIRFIHVHESVIIFETQIYHYLYIDWVQEKAQKFTWGILDGAWVHCEIKWVHFWLLHAHPTSRSIIKSLSDSLLKDKPSIVWWDFNLSLIDWAEAVDEWFSFIHIKYNNKKIPTPIGLSLSNIKLILVSIYHFF